MLHGEKVLVIDVDGTLCETRQEGQSYLEVAPNREVIERLRQYREDGFWVVLYSSRQMRTYAGNMGEIYAKTLPVLIEWLNKHGVPYDEIHMGKPWCGTGGFYVDDKTIRPDEFLKLGYAEIKKLLKI